MIFVLFLNTHQKHDDDPFFLQDPLKHQINILQQQNKSSKKKRNKKRSKK